MKRELCFFLLCSLVLWTGASVLAQETIELRFMCFNDGNECAVYDDLLSRFSSVNPGIAVAVEIVSQAEADEQLSQQVEAGEAPDIARVADFDGLAGHYLDLRPLLLDPEILTAHFQSPYFEAMRVGADADGLYGFPDAAAVVAPYVNASLFEEAGVDLPGDGVNAASWDDWLAALEKVAQATGVPFALSVDNKDHRLVAPAMSLGATYFAEDGALTLDDDDGLRAFLQILSHLKEAGRTPVDTLLGTGKSQDYFVRGETAMYICGSWKVESVAAEVGAEFEWAIVPNPGGAGGSTGVVGATALVAFGGTEHPQAVAKVFDYLLQPEVYAEFSARTLTIPAHLGVAALTLEYDTDDDIIAAALHAFVREVPQLQDQAIALDLHPLAPVYYRASNTYLQQYFAGELTLDEAIASMRERLSEATADMASG